MIRDAKIEDAKALIDIYSYYILNTAITFEIEIPSIAEFEGRIKEISSEYPYIVLEENNKILGYAYAHPYIKREACKYDVEVSIYLDNNVKGHGYGKALYTELENRLKKMGIINLYSAVARADHNKFINDNSINFHKHLGYTECGYFKECGYKFGNWYDLVWLEKKI